jgi:hypothetical protein
MDMVVAVGAAAAQTEAQTTTGLTLKIPTTMLTMQTKRIENTNVKTIMSRISLLFFFCS